MKYDFDTVIDRSGTDSVKWAMANPGELPMWVADMDFPAAPEILAALRSRLRHGVFGYSLITEDWYDAYISWWRDRHGFTMERDWLSFCTGIVPALSSIIRALTRPGDKVLLQSPVYNCFFSCILDNDRRVSDQRLLYENGRYAVDFAELEEKLADPDCKLMLLCNPHNPIGKLWDEETLERIGTLCAKHQVTVVSDEIHCDLTEPGRDYVPFGTLSEACRDNCVICLAPTKTFNLAGLKTAAVCVPNKDLREKVRRALHNDGISDANALAVPAAVSAFTQGGPWLEQLREYLSGNRRRVAEFLKTELPRVRLVDGEATYLLWLDLGESATEFQRFLREKAGLFLIEGAHYGSAGENFLRMNIACPRSMLEYGLRRLKTGADAYFSIPDAPDQQSPKQADADSGDDAGDQQGR